MTDIRVGGLLPAAVFLDMAFERPYGIALRDPRLGFFCRVGSINSPYRGDDVTLQLCSLTASRL
jgi:hypothetical protein